MTKYGMSTGKSSEVTSNAKPITSSNNGVFDQSHLPHLPITGYKLNGNNYLQWSQSVLMLVCRKGKDDYLIVVATEPKKEKPTQKGYKEILCVIRCHIF